MHHGDGHVYKLTGVSYVLLLYTAAENAQIQVWIVLLTSAQQAIPLCSLICTCLSPSFIKGFSITSCMQDFFWSRIGGFSCPERKRWRRISLSALSVGTPCLPPGPLSCVCPGFPCSPCWSHFFDACAATFRRSQFPWPRPLFLTRPAFWRVLSRNRFFWPAVEVSFVRAT